MHSNRFELHFFVLCDGQTDTDDSHFNPTQLMLQYHDVRVPSSHPTVKSIDAILDRLLEGADRELLNRKLDWEVVVLNVPRMMNAFVLPNGKVVVFSGM